MKHTWFRHFGPAAPRPAKTARDGGIAAGILGATVLLEELLRLLGIKNVELALLFMLSTFLIACLSSSYVINISSAIINAFLYDYFVTAPRLGFSFTLGLPITLLIMLLVSIITSAITTKINEQMSLARQQERRTELMLTISKRMSVADNLSEIIQIAADYLSLSGIGGVFYLGNPLTEAYTLFSASGDRPQPPPASPDVQQAYSCYLEPDRCKMTDSRQSGRCHIPVTAANAPPLGVIALYSPPPGLSKEQIAFAYLLAGQTALAMELLQMREERTATLMLAEKEKTRSNLLRAISHDLRTPLTGILSASSILEEKTGHALATDIRTDSQRLIHMVENLLMVTRISEDKSRITKKDEQAEEIMARSTAIVRKQFPGCCISVNAPEELIVVPMDALLISQVFINLLENAARYSPAQSPILFNLLLQEGWACFTVSDNGCGIPLGLLSNLFDQHASGGPQSIDSASGMGLGLSICKTIVEAHGGFIRGENKEAGGALFTVCLPMDA